MRVPLNEPSRGVQLMHSEIRHAFDRVLSSGWLVMGPENEALADELSLFLDTPHTVLVGNGTDALEIALATVGVRSGATVLTVANAGGYSTTAIRQVGGTPLYVDIEPLTLQMSVDSLKAVLAGIPEKPSAIVVTHLYGHAAPIEAICSLSALHGIPVVEDCAQSLGGMVSGKRLGTFGQISTTSFYPTKNLGALGDGGAIFTANSAYAVTARALRQYGWSKRYHTDLPGGRNSRLDEIQAAVLRMRLPLLDRLNTRRRKIHTDYRGVNSRFGYLPHTGGKDFVAHLCIMLSDQRDRVRSIFEAEGIATDIHYPIPDHLQRAYRGTSTQSLPVTEEMADRVLTLPLFPEMVEEELDRVMGVLGG